MFKKIIICLVTLVICTSFSGGSGTATQGHSNPFFSSDYQRTASLQHSRNKFDKSEITSKNSKNDEKYIVSFKQSTSLKEIYNCISSYSYNLLGDSEQRMFALNISDLSTFKEKYKDKIENISKNGTLKALSVTNDTYFDQQWELDDINITKAWDITKGSSAVTIAVIDSGFDRNFQDFSSTQILAGADVTQSNAPVSTDSYGHGTSVISVIAAEANNGEGIAGASYNVSVMPIKASDNDGYFTDASLIKAINLAADSGCDVISMSLGGYYNDSNLQNAINYAAGKGCIIVAASGNEGDPGNSEAGQFSYPASCKNVVSVAAVNRQNQRAYFSQYNSSVDVTAPGQDILVAQAGSSNQFVSEDGTSFSTPYVAAIAGLVKSVNKSINGVAFEQLISKTSTQLGEGTYNSYYGWGLINAEAMIKAAQNQILGITEDGKYNKPVCITFQSGTATLNGDTFTSGTTVSANGNYSFSYTDLIGNTTVIDFSINNVAPIITVKGYSPNYSYINQVSVTFNKGVGTLNGNPFSSGDSITQVGTHTLTVTDDYGNTATSSFTIIRSTPYIFGVDDGQVYFNPVTPIFKEPGTATLNDEPFSGGTISEPGSYTLVFTDTIGLSRTVHFNIYEHVEKTTFSSINGDTFNGSIYDSSSGYLCAYDAHSHLYFINKQTMKSDTMITLSGQPSAMINDTGILYISYSSTNTIQAIDIGSQTIIATYNTSGSPKCLAKDGDNLYYSTTSGKIYNFSISNRSDIQIMSNYTINSPVLNTNTKDHILYVGSSDSKCIYYYYELTSNVEYQDVSKYITSYSSPSIIMDSNYVYFGQVRYDLRSPHNYTQLPDYNIVFADSGILITTLGRIYNQDTLLYIGTMSSVKNIYPLDSDELLYIFGSSAYKVTGTQNLSPETLPQYFEYYVLATQQQIGVIPINDTTKRLTLPVCPSKLVPDNTNGTLYAIASNVLYSIDQTTLEVHKKFTLSSVPTDMMLCDGKLYIALDSGNQVLVLDTSSQTFKPVINTSSDPYLITISNGILYYAQKSGIAAIHAYNLLTSEETLITKTDGSGFNCAALAADDQRKLLYIGESNSATAGLYYYDENTGSTSSCSKTFNMPTRMISLAGNNVFYASIEFAAGINGNIKASWNLLVFGVVENNGLMYMFKQGGNDILNISDNSIVVSKSFSSYSQAVFGTNKMFVLPSYNSDCSIYAISSPNGNFDSSNVNKLLGGQTPKNIKGQTGTQLDYNLQFQSLYVSKIIHDQSRNKLFAISAQDRKLICLDGTTLNVTDVIDLNGVPYDISQNGNMIYVSVPNSYQIFAINADSFTISKTINIDTQPTYIAAGTNDLFYVSNSSDVLDYQLSQATSTTVVSGLPSCKIAVNSADNILYVGTCTFSSSSYSYIDKLYYYSYKTTPFQLIGSTSHTEYYYNTGTKNLIYGNGKVYIGSLEFSNLSPTYLGDYDDNVIAAQNGKVFFNYWFTDDKDFNGGYYLPFNVTAAAYTSTKDLYLCNTGSTPFIELIHTTKQNMSGLTGVTDGMIYDNPVTISYSSGKAYLDGTLISSGTVVSQKGPHVLLYFDGKGNCQSISFDIRQLAQSITLSTTSLNLKYSGYATLKATVLPSITTDKTVTWTSNNQSVAKVSNAGIVSAVGKGTAIITATANDGSGVKASCTVNVELVVNSISISKINRLYSLNQAFDFSNCNILVNYNNNTSEIINVTPDMISGFDSSKTGYRTLTITYKGASIKSVYSVTSKPVKNVSLISQPNKTIYFLNQPLDPTGAMLLLQYEDGTSEQLPITQDMITTYFNSRAGNYAPITSYTGVMNVDFIYGNNIFRFGIQVIQSDLTDITIVSLPSKTTYTLGQTLDTTGLILQGKFYDGTTVILQPDLYTISGYSSITPGTKTVTVTCNNLTTSFDINVLPQDITNVTMRPMTSTSYTQGQPLNLINGYLVFTYADGTKASKAFTPDMISGYDPDKLGAQTLSISFLDYTFSQQITVYAKNLSSIYINTNPIKCNYLTGEPLDLTGATLELNYYYGYTIIVPLTDDMVSGYDPSKLGNQSVKVTTYGMTTYFQVYTAKSLYNITYNSCGGSNVANTILRDGEKLYAPTDPKKTGYYFLGWYTDPTGGTKVNFPYTVTADTTLYAHWANLNSIVTYDTQGGSNILPCLYITGAKIILPNPTKNGYTFNGWYTSANGGTQVTTSYWVFGDTTLYAHWNINYTITFNPNGGSAVPPINATIGSALTPPVEPTRAGYTFAGWSPTFPSTMPLNGASLTAQWTINKYTIRFNSNGGTVVSPITDAYGAIVTPPTEPTRAGYTFAGWSPTFPSTMPLNGATLTAIWTLNNYSVTFDSKGGSSVKPITASYGSEITEPSAPTRSGYTFVGWSPSFPSTMPLNGVTLIAKWTLNNYSVNFDSKGGSLVKPITAPYGSVITKPSAPTRVGYTFVGWSPTFPSTMPLNGVSLTAQWTPNNYTIAFNSNGGSIVDNKTGAFNSMITAPTNPKRIGYSFDGWYTSLSSGTKITFPYKITGKVTLYAHWKVIIYKVTFNGNGGNSPAAKTATYGKYVTAPSNPSRKGYKFLGWYTAASGGTKVSFTYKVTNNVTLYAHWKK